jgi:predicted RNase H-like HicB family nuclease
MPMPSDDGSKNSQLSSCKQWYNPERRRNIESKIEVVISMNFTIEVEQEDDGRWLAEVQELPGVLAYGHTPEDATTKVQALALRVLADRLEHDEAMPSLINVSFAAA